MARPREFDTDTVLEAAMTTFWRDGYESASVSDLVTATGVGRASLYNAFGDKHGLFEACLRHYAEGRVPLWMGRLADGERGLDDIRAFLSQLGGVVAASPEAAPSGCLIMNTSVERGAGDPFVRDMAAEYRADLADAFRAALNRALELGEIEGPIEGRAEVLVLGAMGLFTALRAGADAAEINRLIAGLEQLLDSWARGA
jgi:TetR/AcrR family transcriptional repressor of nem operon